MTTAPQAIRDVFTRVQASVPSAVLSGIVGDAAHSFGYHLSRQDLIARGEPNDYSLVLPLDRLGPDDTASALDISLSPDLMKTVTGRLLAAARAGDPALSAVREFCGTTDGVNTHWYDLPTRSEGLGVWDDSHLWHVHLSFYRAHCTDYAAINGVIHVITGAEHANSTPSTPLIEETDDMWNVIQLKGTKRYAAFAPGQFHDNLSATQITYLKMRKLIRANAIYVVNSGEFALWKELSLAGAK